MRVGSWLKNELKLTVTLEDHGLGLLIVGVLSAFLFFFGLILLEQSACQSIPAPRSFSGLVINRFRDLTSCHPLDSSFFGIVLMILSGTIGYLAGNLSFKIIRDWRSLEFRMSESQVGDKKPALSGKTVLIVVGIFLFAFVFYWFEYRPSEIRKVCSAAAVRNAQIVARTRGDLYASDGIFDTRVRDQAYKACIQAKGLGE